MNKQLIQSGLAVLALAGLLGLAACSEDPYSGERPPATPPQSTVTVPPTRPASPTPAASATAPAQARDRWRLQEARPILGRGEERGHFDAGQASYRLVGKPDGHGGEVIVTVKGENYNLCPGGSEEIRYKWTFDRDVTQLNPGDTFNVDVKGELVNMRAPCRGDIAYRTLIGVINTNSNLFYEDPKLQQSVFDGMAYTDGGPDGKLVFELRVANSVSGRTPVHIGTRGAAAKERTHGSFSFRMAVAGDLLDIAYVYELQPVQ